jgi:hypothetical protein
VVKSSNVAELTAREAALVLGGPDKLGELKDYIICMGRQGARSLPALEPYILPHPDLCYYYAYHVIRGRWRQGEAVIAKDPTIAYWYAVDVVQDRWPRGEVAIMSNSATARGYNKFLIDRKTKQASPMTHSWWVRRGT